MIDSNIYVEINLTFLSSEIHNDNRIYYRFAASIDGISSKPDVEFDLPVDSWVLAEPREKVRQYILDKVMKQVVGQYRARYKMFEPNEIIHFNKSVWPAPKKEEEKKI